MPLTSDRDKSDEMRREAEYSKDEFYRKILSIFLAIAISAISCVVFYLLFTYIF